MRSLKGREVVRALELAGFTIVRTSASHHIMKRAGQEGTVSVPVHAGKDVKTGTLASVIRQSGLTKEQFWAFVENI